MSLRDFMYAADALRLEEGISWTFQPEPGMPFTPVKSPAEIRAQNAKSMAMLTGLMKNVQVGRV